MQGASCRVVGMLSGSFQETGGWRWETFDLAEVAAVWVPRDLRPASLVDRGALGCHGGAAIGQESERVASPPGGGRPGTALSVRKFEFRSGWSGTDQRAQDRAAVDRR